MNVKRPRHPQPMQPIVIASDGVARFQPNAIVEFIVDAMCGANRGGYIVTKDGARLGYNDLMAMPWHDMDRDQFNMLHGYSVSGLPWRQKKVRDEADRITFKLAGKRTRKGKP